MNRSSDITDKMTGIVAEVLAGFPAKERKERLKAFLEGAQALPSQFGPPKRASRDFFTIAHKSLMLLRTRF